MVTSQTETTLDRTGGSPGMTMWIPSILRNCPKDTSVSGECAHCSNMRCFEQSPHKHAQLDLAALGDYNFNHFFSIILTCHDFSGM